MPANIVYLTHSALVNHQINSPAMILYIKPVTNIYSLPVYRKRLIRQGISYHQWNKLFREMIWSIIIAAPADGRWQTIGTMIGHNQQVSPRLGATVRRAGMKWRFLRKKQIRPIQWQITINLISRNLMIPFYPVFSTGIHQHRGANYIGFQKNRRIFD